MFHIQLSDFANDFRPRFEYVVINTRGKETRTRSVWIEMFPRYHRAGHSIAFSRHDGHRQRPDANFTSTFGL